MEYENKIVVPFKLRDTNNNFLNVVPFLTPPLNAARSNCAKTIEKNCGRSESTRRVKGEIINET